METISVVDIPHHVHHHEHDEIKTYEGTPIKRVARRVTHACVSCQKGHLSCDNNRPCGRCTERGKVCEEGESKKRGRKKSKIESPQMPTSTPVVLGSLVPPPQSDTNRFPLTSILNSNEYDDIFMSFPTPPSEIPCNPTLSLDHIWSQVSDLMFSTVDHVDPKTDLKAGLEHLKTFQTQVIKPRFPEFYASMQNIDSQIMDLVNSSNLDNLETGYRIWRQEIEQNSGIYKMLIDHLNFPALFWESGLTLRHVNQSYRNLTGISEIPNRDFSMAEEISDEGLKHFQLGRIQSLLAGKDSWNFPCGFLDHHANAPSKYIQGTFSVTVKLGSMGFPLFWVGIFLPSAPTFPEKSPEELPWGSLVSQVGKTLQLAQARISQSSQSSR
eukprot:TRINITY_DN10543_c0_g1_i2.p1 TRINITY_DN10543_c0_g1~~TRINITY_DN10543_c0_g1_i2.p1  ORF type:complete len:383 (+),score=103.89 TRINITY_DN10543_c0_g1_i2:33-1181(+)